jgi:hypothetical protein
MQQEQCKKCGSKNIIMVEYDMMHPDHYDGVSEIFCQDCHVRIGRWSGRELGSDETEKRKGRV